MLSVKIPFVVSLVLGALVAFIPATAEAQVEAADRLDKQPRNVSDVLREHCMRCHGPRIAKANLRFDVPVKASAKSTQGTMLFGEPDSSELLKRLTSKDPSFRMPKGEPRLPESDIELLRNWIANGTPEVEFSKSTRSSTPAATDKDKRMLTDVLQDIWEARDSIKFLAYPTALYLIFFLVVERLRKRTAQKVANVGSASNVSTWLSQLHRFHFVYGAVLIVLMGLLLTANSRSNRIQDELNMFREEAPYIPVPETSSSDPFRPTIYRPKHPPRLGGQYYRGNDERDPALFNGGYYRTAVMTLDLIEGTDKVLQWNDEIDDSTLSVRLTIQRAPNATSTLFDETALTRCYLTKGIPKPDTVFEKGEQAFFATLVPGESWEARYPIKLGGSTNTMADEGRIYLWAGDATPHYGIVYSLRCESRHLQESSELWMGAMYLTPGVFIPKTDRIPIAEWFDFLPIPEISSENSDDPRLLGITPKPEP